MDGPGLTKQLLYKDGELVQVKSVRPLPATPTKRPFLRDKSPIWTQLSLLYVMTSSLITANFSLHISK
mgnify:CR=1 FL=1